MVLPPRFELGFAASETAALSIELRELTNYYTMTYVNIKSGTIIFKPKESQTLSTFDLYTAYLPE